MDTFLQRHRNIASKQEECILSGYVRQVQNSFPDNTFYVIPDLVIFICLAYYYEPEQWDINTKTTGIDVDGNNINHTDNDYDRISLTKIAEKGIHVWRFRINHIIDKGWNVIGIWKCNHQFADIDECGYGFIFNEAKLTNADVPVEYGDTYGIIVKKNANIEMKLDMDEWQLSYTVDGKDLGIAFRNIEKTQYKAGITIYHKLNEIITFLSYFKTV